MTASPLRVVVAGGGVAGIATALRLADGGHDVRLVERRPFLGGRVYSFDDAALCRGLDNGQHAMLGCYRETLALLERIGSSRRLHWLGLRMEMRELGRTGYLHAGRVPAPFHLARALLGYRLLSRQEQVAAMWGALRLLVAWRRNPERLARRTVASVLAEVGQSEAVCQRLWTPIAIAALNVHPSRACASLFAAVVERAFFGSARDASIVLPGAPLSEVFGEPAAKALGASGVRLSTRTSLAEILVDEAGGVDGVRMRDGAALECDAVVLALPPQAIGALAIGTGAAEDVLGSWVRTLAGGVPIVSTHVPLDRTVALPAMLGLIGTTAQWVFHTDRFQSGSGGPSLLSCVTSDAAELDGLDDREIATRVVAELERYVPEVGRVDAARVRVVREKHATIPATVDATAARPRAATSVPGVFLAGDWVRTGLPATLESAAESARLACAEIETFEPKRHVARRGRAA